jgi:hypothetical protein
MTHKTAFKFIVLATIAIALGIVARPSAVEYFTFTDQARAKQPVGGRPEIAVIPNPQLSRVRLLVSNLNWARLSLISPQVTGLAAAQHALAAIVWVGAHLPASVSA